MQRHLKIKIDTRAAERQLAGMQRQIPFAKAAAVNDLAFQAMRAENEAMPKVFHRPRPFTQKATQVERKATKANATASVSLRKAQARYLEPYELGGLHVTPGKALLEPVGVKLDQYGQLPKGLVQKLAADPTVFVGTVKGIAGFWRRLKNHHLKLLIRFGKNKPVTEHLDFRKRAIEVVRRRGPAAMQAAIAKTIATARK